MGHKQEIMSTILDGYQQQQRIAVSIQEVLAAEAKAVQAGDGDALARAASYFEDLSREYLRLEALRREKESAWASDGDSTVEEAELRLAREELYRDLRQAQDTAVAQQQPLQVGLDELKAQHNLMLQGKQALRVYGEGRSIDPRCIDQHR